MVVQGIDDGTWVAPLARALPEFEVHDLDADIEPATVTHVAMWRVAPERLATFPALEAVLLMGAGYDHLDLAAMPDVPIVRLMDPAMASDISLYVLSWVIHFQRDFDRYAALQRSTTWRGELQPTFAREYTVGVLGAGTIGTAVLHTCAQHGFRTVGWSRSAHDRPLLQFFEDCDIVVDLVPLSDATRGLVGADELNALGDGVLINIGRGPTVDTAALLDALDGDLRHAVLDVFDTEPLPADSALWNHPLVTVTPHIAGRSDATTAAPVMAASIAALRAGQTPDGLVTR